MNELVIAFNQIVDAWSAAMWRVLWIGIVVVALAGALACLWKRKSPVVHCWLWRLAYIKLLALLLWSSSVDVPLLPQSSEIVAAPVENTVESEAGMNIAPGNIGVSTPTVEHVESTKRHHVRTSLSLLGLVLVAWFAGVCIGSARMVRELRFVRVQLQHLSDPPRYLWHAGGTTLRVSAGRPARLDRVAGDDLYPVWSKAAVWWRWILSNSAI